MGWLSDLATSIENGVSEASDAVKKATAHPTPPDQNKIQKLNERLKSSGFDKIVVKLEDFKESDRDDSPVLSRVVLEGKASINSNNAILKIAQEEVGERWVNPDISGIEVSQTQTAKSKTGTKKQESKNSSKANTPEKQVIERTGPNQVTVNIPSAGEVANNIGDSITKGWSATKGWIHDKTAPEQDQNQKPAQPKP